MQSELVLKGTVSKIDAEWAGGFVTCNIIGGPPHGSPVTVKWGLAALPDLGLPIGTEVEVVIRLPQGMVGMELAGGEDAAAAPMEVTDAAE